MPSSYDTRPDDDIGSAVAYMIADLSRQDDYAYAGYDA